MNKEQIDEIALRIAGEMPCCLNHIPIEAGVVWSADEVTKYARDLIAELAKVSEPVGYFFNDGNNNWFEGESDTGIPLFTHPLPQPALVAEIDQLKADLENERMRLAACGVAALGYFDGCNDEYISASLNDTLRLYAANTELRQQLSAAQANNEQLVKALERCKFDSLNMTFDDLKRIREAIAAHKARQQAPSAVPEGWRCPTCNTDLRHEHAYGCIAAAPEGKL